MVIIPEGERKMKLSDKEKSLIENLRNGAKISQYVFVDTYEEVENLIKNYKIERLYEMEDEEHIIFGSSSDNPEIVIYLSTGKEVKE